MMEFQKTAMMMTTICSPTDTTTMSADEAIDDSNDEGENGTENSDDDDDDDSDDEHEADSYEVIGNGMFARGCNLLQRSLYHTVFLTFMRSKSLKETRRIRRKAFQ